jgi:hypothetical protein
MLQAPNHEPVARQFVTESQSLTAQQKTKGVAIDHAARQLDM